MLRELANCILTLLLLLIDTKSFVVSGSLRKTINVHIAIAVRLHDAQGAYQKPP